MQTSIGKLNEHPRCGCFHCRHRDGFRGIKMVHRNGNRRIRHEAKLALRQSDETPVIIISTMPT